MPSLAYETADVVHAGPLTGRALIGRRLSHGVELSADPAVSRLHAWVDPTPDGGWVVTDAGSQNGVAVNGRRVDRQALRDGDEIRVGHTRIRFVSDPPADAEPVALSPPHGEPVRTPGILFDCACGAPIWVGDDLAGKRGRCRHCKRQVVVPTPAAEPTAAPAEAVAGSPARCGVCHAGVAVGDPLKVCPECETSYHAECWAENLGCSTYGCGQVDALNPHPPEPAAAEPVAPHDPADDAPPPPRMQWEWLTVLAALLASAVGALAFGVLSAAVAVTAVAMIVRRRPDTRVGLLVVAVAVAVVGVAVGLVASDVWWLGGRLP